MKAKYGVKVCNNAADMATTVGDDGKLHVAFKDDLAVSATAYESDPTATTFEEKNNSLADFSEGIQSMVTSIPVLPGVTVIEEGKDFLKGVARSVGGGAAAQAVAPKVWYVVRQPMAEEIRSETYDDLQEKAEVLGSTLGFEESDIIVDLPEEPTFTDEYEPVLDALEAKNNKEEDGFTLSFEKPDFSNVVVSIKDMKVVTEQ